MLENIAVGNMRLVDIEKMLAERIWSTKHLSFTLPGIEEKVLSLSELGLSWDKSETLKRIHRAGRGWGGYSLRIYSLLYKKPIRVTGALLIDELKLDQAMSMLAELVYRPPRDASFVINQDRVAVIPEEEGRFLKLGVLRKAILNALYTRRQPILLPVGVLPAARTADELESHNVRQVMASFYTEVAAGNPDRAHNIKLSSAAFSGYLLAPGDILSFNNTVGRVTREKGYRYAPIIVGDELVPGLGGGICQVSTTLYNAALFANLEIVERHNHSMPIAYIPLGRDSTVVFGSLDLKIRNNQEHYLLIGAELTDLRLTFRIFGLPMDEQVEIISTGHQRIAPPVRHKYTDALPDGVREISREGKAGHYITTWRVIYLNNREISREKLDRDFYAPVAAVYLVGTGTE
jgi:vancomycin resistance protein YoaR